MTTPFGISRDIWPRVSALYDELIDTDERTRAARLAEIQAREPAIATALVRLLTSNESEASERPDNAKTKPFASLLSVALNSAESSRHPGERFGAWTLVALLGRGGMGEVWRATRSDGLYNGEAAIKLLRSDLPAEKLAARFARERSVLARLNHPNIARLLDAGAAEGNAYLVLELVQGKSLFDYVAAFAPTISSRVVIVRDLARAIAHAHAQLVLHRDVKPSNVLVTASGAVKLLDFGVAAAIDDIESADTVSSLTQLTGRGLTVEYAAPEQIIGDRSVAASDVYSLGVMLYELCTGARPFADRKGRSAIEYAAIHEEAARASSASRSNQNASLPQALDSHRISGDLDAILAKALRKSAPERYATASALADDLDAWLNQSPISIRAEDRSYRAKLWIRRNWTLAALGAVAVASLSIGLGASLYQRNVAVAAAQLAKAEAARATKVADYMGELIQSANPDSHGGKWPTVIALLEQAEKDFDQSFNDDPKTKALLLQRLADTNNVLNRDAVALGQYEALLAMFDSANESATERAIDSRSNYADMLKRLNRDEAALVEFEKLEPLTRKHYGEKSEPYASLLAKLAIERARAARIDEARTLLARSQSIIRELFPNNLRKRMDSANDLAVALTRAGLWREAEQALAANESDFAQLSTLEGASGRDALIQRNNLEAIRIRIGKYDGVDDRLRANALKAVQLFGGDSPISYRTEELRANLAGSEGRFAEMFALTQQRIENNAKRKGFDPASQIDDELFVIRSLATHTELRGSSGEKSNAELRAELATRFDAILQAIPVATQERSNMFRGFADVALALRAHELAARAITQARDDAAAVNLAFAERLAQIERVSAALAFAQGDAPRAVKLLAPRFAAFVATNEGDSPRHATLWLQRALFETSVDSADASRSLTVSRDMFQRLGKIPPHHSALLDYVAALISSDASRIRAAQQALDRAYLRKPTTPWIAPHLPSA
ncbi:MAG: serine/threonine protein kinase [Betaproteobacteria bacterium]|nr:MAG: serine/threonine protein kinase [Betaproteobacteria bacterium]